MPSVKRQSTLALLALIAVTAIWGSTFIVVQDGINRMPMMMFMGWRFVIAFAVMVAIRPRALRMSRAVFRQGLFIGLALSAGYWMQTYGLLYTSATVSGFITGMFVVITPLLAGIIYRTKVPATGWTGIALAVVGLALISLKGWAFGYGEIWTLAGAVAFSFQIMWLSRWATPESSYSIAMMQVGVTAVIFFVGGVAFEGYQVPNRADVWTSIVFLAVFASAMAFIVQTWSQSLMTPTKAAVVLSFEPVFAGIFGVWVGGDPLTTRIVLGGLAIIGAMYLVELNPSTHNEIVEDLSEPHQGF